VGVATPVSLTLDVASLGPWLMAIPVLGLPLLVLALSALVWMVKSSWGALTSLLVGFVLANLLVVGALSIWALFSFEALMGIAWFLLKSFTLVAVFVLMRATFPRVRMDQLMGFAWKWMMPAALLNTFVTAGAILIVRELGA
jgi:NADH:ubiquinone oxidoreductase subunit H